MYECTLLISCSKRLDKLSWTDISANVGNC